MKAKLEKYLADYYLFSLNLGSTSSLIHGEFTISLNLFRKMCSKDWNEFYIEFKKSDFKKASSAVKSLKKEIDQTFEAVQNDRQLLENKNETLFVEILRDFTDEVRSNLMKITDIEKYRNSL